MTKFKPLACGHHSHTHYSLDGGSSPADKIIEASKQGRIADCCTDHGILSGLAPHWFAAEKLHKDGKISKIKSIHGIEAYIIDPDRPHKEYKTGRKEPQYYHLTIHFKTKEAYQYFCKLSAKAEERAVVKYGERKPLITFEELEGISGHVIISSGCLLAPIQSNILRGRSDLAKKYYEYLRTIAGPGNFFVEVMPHQVEKNWKKPEYSENGIKVKDGYFVPADQKLDSDAIDPPFVADPCTGLIDLQKVPNQFVIEMARKFKDPIVMSLDDHFATKEDKVVQSLKLSNGKENWQFYNSLHSMTSEECAEVFRKQLGASDKDIEEWIDNSYLFVESFDKYTFETAKDRILLPTTELVYGVKTDNKQKLYELVQKHGRMPAKDHPEYKVYKDRFVYELDVLTNNGVVDFLPYFFLVEDAMSWARENGVVSMARGSGSGSLIAYLLRIAIADPIKYNLPFERFLTKDRIKTGSFPDFDCVAGDTMIETELGSISISELALMDNIPGIKNLNEETGEFSFNKPLIVFSKGDREVFEYELSNGEKITCTPDHKVLTNIGWIEIEKALEIDLEIRNGN
jgi:DNA polymerase-3 subunit alpha